MILTSSFQSNKRDTAFINYFFSSFNLVINSFSGLFFVPLYIKKLDSIDDYGIWLACLGLISSLSVFEMNLSGVATQKYSDALSKNDISRFKSLVLSNIYLMVIVSIICLFFFIIIIHFFPTIISNSGNSEEIKLILFLCFIGFMAIQYSLSVGAFFQSIQNTIVQNILLSFSLIINVIAVLICLLYYDLGVISFSIGHCFMGIFNFVSLALYALFIWKKMFFGIIKSKKLFISEMLKDSIGLTITTLSSTLKSNLQSPIVAIFISPSSAAILNITGKIIMIFGSLVSNVSSSIYAGFSHLNNKIKREEIKCELKLIINMLSVLFLGFAVLITKGFIILWIDPELYGGILLVAVIAISQYLLIKKSFLSTLVMTTGKFNILSFWLTLELLINVSLLFLFLNVMPQNNLIVSLPLSTLLSTLFINLALHKIENKKNYFDWNDFSRNTFYKFIFIGIPITLFNQFSSLQNKFYFIVFCVFYFFISFSSSFLINKKWRHLNYKLIRKYFP
jgi:O-antigen/teichoic acid export membrane protein